MKKIYFTIFAAALFCGCGSKSNGPSEAEIERMVNERVEKRLAEEKANLQKESRVNKDSATKDKPNDKPKSNANNLRMKRAYETGLEYGTTSTFSLEESLDDNEYVIKGLYRGLYWLEIEEKTDKEMYQEFKRGYVEGLRSISNLD